MWHSRRLYLIVVGISAGGLFSMLTHLDLATMSNSFQAIALTPSTAGFSSTFPNDAPIAQEKSKSSLLGRLRSLFQSNVGLLFIIAAQLTGTCMNVTVKLLNELDPPVPTFEIIFIRMSITWLFSIIVMYYTRVPHPVSGPPGVRHLLAIRGFSGFFGLFGVYYSLVYLSLSDAIVITFLVPTTTAIAGYLLLGESLGRREMMAGIFSFFGVVLIARPEFLFGQHSNNTVPVDGHEVLSEKGTPTQRLIAVGVALLGVLGGTGALISIRAIGHRAHPLHSVSFFSIWCCIVSAVGMVALQIPIVMPQSLAFAVLMFGIGVFGFFTQVFLTMGLQRETASRGSLGLYVQILFAAIAERWIFHATPSYLSLIGTFIILICAGYVALNKANAVEARETTHTLPQIEDHERDSLDHIEDETHGLVSGIKREWTSDMEPGVLSERNIGGSHL